MSNPSPKTTFEWQRECNYISGVTDAVKHSGLAQAHPKMKPFNHDVDCFIGYCQMQQRSARQEEHEDVVTYIGHCLDDLGATDPFLHQN